MTKLKDLLAGVMKTTPATGSAGVSQRFGFSGWRQYYEQFFGELDEALQNRDYEKAQRLLRQFHFYDYDEKIEKHFSKSETAGFRATVSRAETAVTKWLQRRQEKLSMRHSNEFLWDIDDVLSVAERPVPRLTTMFQRLSEKYGHGVVSEALSDVTGLNKETISEYIRRLDSISVVAKKNDFRDYEEKAVMQAIYRQVRDELAEAYFEAFASEHAPASGSENAGEE